MIKIAIKYSLFSVLLAFASPLYAQNQQARVSHSSGLYVFESKQVKEAYYDGDSLSFGIVLSFEDRWPSKEEERLILEFTQKAGLKKTNTVYPPFKWWFFSWPYVRLSSTSLEVCKQFPQNIHYLLEYCDDNVIPRVD